jgi:hypothetical protein
VCRRPRTSTAPNAIGHERLRAGSSAAPSTGAQRTLQLPLTGVSNVLSSLEGGMQRSEGRLLASVPPDEEDLLDSFNFQSFL